MCGNGCNDCPNRVECGICPEYRDEPDYRYQDDLEDYTEIDENGVPYDSPGYAD